MTARRLSTSTSCRSSLHSSWSVWPCGPITDVKSRTPCADRPTVETRWPASMTISSRAWVWWPQPSEWPFCWASCGTRFCQPATTGTSTWTSWWPSPSRHYLLGDRSGTGPGSGSRPTLGRWPRRRRPFDGSTCSPFSAPRPLWCWGASWSWSTWWCLRSWTGASKPRPWRASGYRWPSSAQQEVSPSTTAGFCGPACGLSRRPAAPHHAR